jgi:hypothetical protein
MSMVMNILDFVEAWWRAVDALLESVGVVGRFERSAASVLNPSCSINLRREALEVDLVVWESGEAELAVTSVDGAVSQEHFDDVRNPHSMAAILSRMVKAVALTQPT